jgi:hypothetical protein
MFIKLIGELQSEDTWGHILIWSYELRSHCGFQQCSGIPGIIITPTHRLC